MNRTDFNVIRIRDYAPPTNIGMAYPPVWLPATQLAVDEQAESGVIPLNFSDRVIAAPKDFDIATDVRLHDTTSSHSTTNGFPILQSRAGLIADAVNCKSELFGVPQLLDVTTKKSDDAATLTVILTDYTYIERGEILGFVRLERLVNCQDTTDSVAGSSFSRDLGGSVTLYDVRCATYSMYVVEDTVRAGTRAAALLKASSPSKLSAAVSDRMMEQLPTWMKGLKDFTTYEWESAELKQHVFPLMVTMDGDNVQVAATYKDVHSRLSRSRTPGQTGTIAAAPRWAQECPSPNLAHCDVRGDNILPEVVLQGNGLTHTSNVLRGASSLLPASSVSGSNWHAWAGLARANTKTRTVTVQAEAMSAVSPGGRTYGASYFYLDGTLEAATTWERDHNDEVILIGLWLRDVVRSKQRVHAKRLRAILLRTGSVPALTNIPTTAETMDRAMNAPVLAGMSDNIRCIFAPAPEETHTEAA